MCFRLLVGFYVVFVLTMSQAVNSAFGDVSFDEQPAGGFDACPDYFTSSWANPLDMNDSSDILYNMVPFETQDIGSRAYLGGIFSANATGNGPYFSLLTQGDCAAIKDDVTRYGDNAMIDSSYYQQLSFRMYSDNPTNFRVYWNTKGCPSPGWGIINPQPASKGWKTYSLYLPGMSPVASAGSNAGWGQSEATGLRIYPSMDAKGSGFKFDWIQLTPKESACASASVKYTPLSSQAVSIFLDDAGNRNPVDGYHERTSPAAGIGVQKAVSWNTARLFPGTYSLYALESSDYAAHFLNPWDMKEPGDIISASGFTPVFSDGTLSGTSSGSISLRLPQNEPINAEVFNKLTVAGKGLSSIGFGGVWAAPGAIGNAITMDLSAHPGWNGSISSVEIQLNKSPVVNVFDIDYISIGTSYSADMEPVIPGVIIRPGGLTIKKRPVAPVIQPDQEGGADFFVKTRGKPANMSSTVDIERVDGMKDASMHPGDVFVDSGGNIMTGDYFQATRDPGGGDPQAFFLFYNMKKPVDPTIYKVACWNLDLLMPVNEYHSMIRVIWERDKKGYDGDDILARTTGDHRYCQRMDTMPIEQSEPVHPWRRNSDGSNIRMWRIDPMEELAAITFRMDEVRLAADHEADSQFAIVVGGDRDADAAVYCSASSPTSGGELIGTMPAGRNTDVMMWNTSHVAPGKYYIYTTTSSGTFKAGGPVDVRHPMVFPDSTPPVLKIDAPLQNHIFNNSLEISGYAVDGTKVAVIEVLLDGNLLGTVFPRDFRKEARDAFPAYPYNSTAGFQKFLDATSIVPSSYDLVIRAYDTAGNVSTYTASVTKTGGASTPPVNYPVPNEPPLSYTSGISPTPVVPGKQLKLSLSVSKTTVNYNITGIDSACSQLRMFASPKSALSQARAAKNKPVFIYKGNSKNAVLTGNSKLKKAPDATKPATYIHVDCGNGSKGETRKLNYKKLKFRKGAKRIPLKIWWKKQLAGRFKKAS